MLLAIIAAVLAYRKAKETGRNAIPWAIAGAAVFIGTQFLVSFAIGMFLGIGQLLWGWSDAIYDTIELPGTIVAIAASFFTSWLLLRYLDKNPEDAAFDSPPPPPPTFGGNQ